MAHKHECKTYRPNIDSGKHFKYAHAKLDGIWLEIRRHAFTAVVEARTSLPRDITEKLRIKKCEWFRRCEELLPNRGVIYGELYVPGEQAAKVSTALAQRGVIPIPEYYNLQFMPFAALWDVSMRPKLWADSTLKHVETEIRQTLDLPFAPWLTIPVGITADEFIKTPEARAILERYEGVVFKDGNLENWHKYKPVLTCDCVVLDFTDGMGKYEGMIGALVLGLYAPDGTIREVAYAGGMDDETRIGITANQDKVIGSVCEVAYQCAGSAGRLRHPRFLRFRDDKAAEDCKLTQLQTEQLQ